MNNIDELEAEQKRLNIRVLLSMAIFCVFVIAGLIAGFSRLTLVNQGVTLGLGLLWVASILVLPRETLPRKMPVGRDDLERDRIDFIFNNLIALRTRATYLRVFYAIVVAVVVFALPRLGT